MSETSAEKSINPLALNVAQTAKILSKVGGKSVTEDMIRSDIDAGAPTNADGKINMVHYTAWLAAETRLPHTERQVEIGD